MASILLVDDQPDVRELIAIALEREGHVVTEAGDAAGALGHFDGDHDIDLVLLDIGLPGCDGLEVMRRLRTTSDVPVILVTGRNEESERILGLRMGADDYVVKPFSLGELMARVATVLRRHAPPLHEPHDDPDDHESFTSGPLAIHRRQRLVELRGRPVTMTAREFELLDHLAAHPHVVFSRDELLRDIWHSKAEWQDPATVTEHVRRLRHKLEDDPADPQMLQTVRGVGYRFVPAPT